MWMRRPHRPLFAPEPVAHLFRRKDGISEWANWRVCLGQLWLRKPLLHQAQHRHLGARHRPAPPCRIRALRAKAADRISAERPKAPSMVSRIPPPISSEMARFSLGQGCKMNQTAALAHSICRESGSLDTSRSICKHLAPRGFFVATRKNSRNVYQASQICRRPSLVLEAPSAASDSSLPRNRGTRCK